MNRRLMEEMTWEEVRDAASEDLPVVLSIGSTEQHGPHLPLATDCIIPVGIALKAAAEVPLIVAPPVRYGAKSRALSGGGETFPGTLSLRGNTLVETLRDVLLALEPQWLSQAVRPELALRERWLLVGGMRPRRRGQPTAENPAARESLSCVHRCRVGGSLPRRLPWVGCGARLDHGDVDDALAATRPRAHRSHRR